MELEEVVVVDPEAGKRSSNSSGQEEREDQSPDDRIPPAEDPRKLQTLARAQRWVLFPLLFVVCIWLLALPTYKTTLLDNTPALWKETIKTRPVIKAPPIPESKSDAFKLGELFNLFKNANSEKQKKSILEDASKILKTKFTLSESQFRALLQEIIAFENHKSVWNAIAGWFSFVHIMWIFAIGGLTVSLVPCVYYVSKPIHQYIEECMTCFARTVKKVIVAIWENVQLPTIVFLHQWGIQEFIVYAASQILTMQGYRYIDESIGVMISLSGMCAGILCYQYSCNIWMLDQVLPWEDGVWGPVEVAKILAWKVGIAFTLFSMFPMAYHYDSIQLGYFTVGLLYFALAMVRPLKWFVDWCGFDRDRLWDTATGSSFFLFVAFFGTRIANGGCPEFLHAFEPALSVLTGAILFTHLYCGVCCNWRERSYVIASCLMIFLVTFSISYGEYSGLTGMKNTGIVFGVLWVWTILLDFVHREAKACIWPVIFFISLFTWRVALYLNENPEFIVKIWTQTSQTGSGKL